MSICLALCLLLGLYALAQAHNVQTTALNPVPIRITLDQLPAPLSGRSADAPPAIAAVPEVPVLHAPPGFSINVFAGGSRDGIDLARPRWLALTPDNSVLVTETPKNQIRLLRDNSGQGFADQTRVFAGPKNGLRQPFGMAFAPGSFYVANTDAVLRFPFSQGQQAIDGRAEKLVSLPGQGYNQHWTRNIVLTPDGRGIFVSIGSATNDDVEKAPRATVQQMNIDGTGMQTLASGTRNPVGMDINPRSGELFVTVNERDGLGDDLVPDYFTHLEAGAFYGWPYTYLAPHLLDPDHSHDGKSDEPALAARTRTPDVLLQAHSAPLGLTFYRGQTFPARYRGGAFIACRGSWNRSVSTGYKIIFVPFGANNRPLGYYEDFVTGFLTDADKHVAWGRPVGIISAADGSLLFSDESNNRIYRVQYESGAAK